MKLLLTSDGLSSRKIKKQFLKLLDKPVNENRVLIMYTTKSKRYKKYLRKIKKSLVSLGIDRKKIIYANISRNISLKKFNDINIFFSCGGNTYYILDRVRKTGFDKFIKSFVKKGIYIGLSAGSILVHKTIEIAGWGKEADINEIDLKNLNGLGLVNIAIFPHFKKRQEKEVLNFKKKAKYPIVVLRDGQALLINGSKKKIIR